MKKRFSSIHVSLTEGRKAGFLAVVFSNLFHGDFVRPRKFKIFQELKLMIQGVFTGRRHLDLDPPREMMEKSYEILGFPGDVGDVGNRFLWIFEGSRRV